LTFTNKKHPLVLPDPHPQVFFASSLATRVVFLTTLAFNHFGPAGEDALTRGDGHYRMTLMALFYAAYSTDILQMVRRPDEFAKSFRHFMIPHHVLSLAWFTPWLVWMAPRGVEGAPIFNTVSGGGVMEAQGAGGNRLGGWLV